MTVEEIYGNRIRVRVVGVLKLEDTYLLVNHAGLNEDNVFWHFPGGGIEAHETIESALKREFLEETNLEIEVGDFIQINEQISPPLHALELMFKVTLISGNLKTGQDPELNIIRECSYLSKSELSNLPLSHLSKSIFDII